MIDWHNPRTVERRDTSLAFAVRVVDAFGGEWPGHGVTVGLESLDDEPIRNPSGYHCFLDLEPDAVTLSIDGGARFADERRTVVLDGDAPADATPPVVDVTDRTEPVVVELTPTPAYQFPSNTTLVRGHVETADGSPVAGATVTLREFEPTVETTETGEFALWVPLSAEHVARRDGRNVVVVDDGSDGGSVENGGRDSDPTLEVTHPDYADATERLTVASGTDTVHYVTLE